MTIPEETPLFQALVLAFWRFQGLAATTLFTAVLQAIETRARAELEARFPGRFRHKGTQPRQWQLPFGLVRLPLVKLWDRPEPVPGKLLKAWYDGESLTEIQKRTLAQYGIYGEQPQALASSREETNPSPRTRTQILTGEYEWIHARAAAGETHEQIAADYRVTQQRVSQIVQLVEARQREPEPVAPRKFPQSDPAYLRRRRESQRL